MRKFLILFFLALGSITFAQQTMLDSVSLFSTREFTDLNMGAAFSGALSAGRTLLGNRW
jgi:hypothetical protein